MDKKRDPYEILGLTKDASKSEIERRYYVLLKRYKIEKSENPEVEFEIDEINNAYNILMGYTTEDTQEKKNKKPNPVLGKLGIDEKKAANFFHYYKYHIIISLLVIIFVAYTVRGCVTKVPSDFNIAFIGNYHYTDTTSLKEKILNEWPEVNEITIDGAMLSEDGDVELNYAMQMKAAVLFGAGDVDVFILDKDYFEIYAKQGAFISLDEIAEELNIDIEKNMDYILKVEIEEGEEIIEREEHLYGIDVSESQIFSDTGIYGDEKIAAIFIRTERFDLAVKFLDLLLKSTL